MGYNTLSQEDHGDRENELDNVSASASASASASSRSPDNLASPVLYAPLRAGALGLFLDQDHDDDRQNTSVENSPSSNGFSNLVQSITSGRTGRTNASYDMIEEEDYAEDARSSPALNLGERQTALSASPDETRSSLHNPIPRPSRRRRSPPATTASTSSIRSTRSRQSNPPLRTASGRDLTLRHPTPDLQTLQGAYTGNIEQLEKTAERLSMTSSIDDAIRELHDEQKRSDSRRSSLLESQGMRPVSRQVSNASSIVEVNSAARSGGYSPAGFMMSPKGSFTAGSGRGRSASKSSKFGSRPEPELEGRPLDSFVNTSLPPSPVLSRSVSIPENPPLLPQSDVIHEQDENSATLTLPILGPLEDPDRGQKVDNLEEQYRPATSASQNTVEQSQTMFADFDGVHVEPAERRTVSGTESHKSDNTQRRVSSGTRLSMARPQSYADPTTGQQMVYYPAPVPMMLNLPQRLSKNPSSMARNKRRTQVMSNIPQGARQSAIWLPDVLETEDEPNLAIDDPAQRLEYIPQHQRMTMGGRRNTQDVSHLPPQIRATTFFELPGPNQVVELKEQSAVATLDSILDASAHAPVSAFTDHAYAGALGAEVYGRQPVRNSKSSVDLLNFQTKKRISSFNLLSGRRASSTNLLETDKENRSATMPGLIEPSKTRQPIDDDSEDENAEATIPLHSDNGDAQSPGDYGLGCEGDEEQQEEVYHGPPTTLLAELQLRKQQQKQRTRPLTNIFPNGVHSTLLELDAVAQVEQKTRKQKRINLAWEDPSLQNAGEGDGDDEDVPLALLYAKKDQDRNRPMGLMERRDMEDNEPLSRRRDRLHGRPLGANRASTMMNLSTPAGPDEEGETLAQRVRRLKAQETTVTGLPPARPVSGDFASEMMSQFGGDLLNPKGKGQETSTPPAEDETLGQRRKRLQAERESRALEVGNASDALERPAMKARRSMANILQAHPAAGADRVTSYQKPLGGLLGLHEQKSQQRASTMMNLQTRELPSQRNRSGGFEKGMYNDGQGGIVPQQPRTSSYNMFPNANIPQFAQPTLGGFNNGGYGNFSTPMMMQFANTYAMNMGYMNNMQNGMGGMGAMNGMGMPGMPGMPYMNMGTEPLNQGQIDMVERWRQSVMQ